MWVEHRAYAQGVAAGAEGKPQNSNPYRRYPISLEWEMGWFDGYDSGAWWSLRDIGESYL